MKISSRIAVLGKVRKYLPVKHRVMLFNSLILPHFDYASIVWSNTSSKFTNPLVLLQRRAARVIWGTSSSEVALRESRWIPMNVRWICQRAVMVFRVARGLVPPYMNTYFIQHNSTNSNHRVTRGQTSGNFVPCKSYNEWGRRRLASHGVFIWNNLPCAAKSALKLNEFKCRINRLARDNYSFYKLKT